MHCDTCKLELANPLLFKCDGHCAGIYCRIHMVAHAKELQMTHRTIPSLLKKMKKETVQ